MDHLEPIFALQPPAMMSARSVAPAKAERQPAGGQTAEYGCVDWFPYLPALGGQSGWIGADSPLGVGE
jgi:hypothetical protein